MTNYTFDTLEASKRLREAGMAEGVAEAVVAVFQHATTGLDLSHLATKVDLAELRSEMATKADLAETSALLNAGLTELRSEMGTKAELEAVRADMATKADVQLAVQSNRADLFSMEARVVRELHSSVRAYTIGAVAMLGGVIGIATAVIKYAP